MGLTTRSLAFKAEGSAEHVHDIVMKEYPILENTGGYTLLRLAENSHNLIEIDNGWFDHSGVFERYSEECNIIYKASSM